MSSLEASKLFRVDGMAFVITGGGSGLGEMMANALDVNGATKVFILGRRKEALDRVTRKANSSMVPIVCDITSKESLACAVAQIKQQTSFLNAVIANAGIAGPLTGFHDWQGKTPTLSDFYQLHWNIPTEHASSTFDLNVVGSFYTCIAFLELLAAGNDHPDSPGKAGLVQSQFISTSSMAGFSRNEIVGYHYGASKAALTHLTKMLATNLAPYSVRSNAICPGLFPSEATEPFLPPTAREPGSFPREVHPTTRSGSEEDMAGTILYLTSRAGGYLNGSVLLVDGGSTSTQPSSC